MKFLAFSEIYFLAFVQTREEREEDDKLSKQHDEDREWEQSSSTIPDAKVDPVPEYAVDVDMPEAGGVDIEA